METSDTYNPSDLPGPILTVGHLRALLASVDPSTQVVIADSDGWYVNVAATIVPGGDENAEYSAVTLIPGAPIDARQF